MSLFPLNSNLLLLIRLHKFSLCNIPFSLNSNLLLLIRVTSLNLYADKSSFKFQSASINTAKCRVPVTFYNSFKFQSASINTYLSLPSSTCEVALNSNLLLLIQKAPVDAKPLWFLFKFQSASINTDQHDTSRLSGASFKFQSASINTSMAV